MVRKAYKALSSIPYLTAGVSSVKPPMPENKSIKVRLVSFIDDSIANSSFQVSK